MSQLLLFPDSKSRSDSARHRGAAIDNVSGKSGSDVGPTRVQSRITETPLVVRPSHAEFLQLARWAADAPPRAEMERRADLLHARFVEHSTRSVPLRVQVSGARAMVQYEV